MKNNDLDKEGIKNSNKRKNNTYPECGKLTIRNLVVKVSF
jgi:hypothetical protein